MDKRATIFTVSLLTWMLLNWQFGLGHIIAGFLVSLFISYIVGDLFAHNIIFQRPARLFRFVFIYLPLFFTSMIKAAFSVAYRILHPDLPFKPGIVKVRTVLRTDTALTLLANAITLTSGTLTVDIDHEEGFLYVHWVDVKTCDVETATQLIVGRFEPIIKSIFE